MLSRDKLFEAPVCSVVQICRLENVNHGGGKGGAQVQLIPGEKLPRTLRAFIGVLVDLLDGMLVLRSSWNQTTEFAQYCICMTSLVE